MSPLPTELTAAEPAVATRDLIKDYPGQRALDRLALTVPRGAFYALVGENGAGKTTAFKILLDLARSTAGSAQVFGIDSRDAGARGNPGSWDAGRRRRRRCRARRRAPERRRYDTVGCLGRDAARPSRGRC